MSEAGRRVTLRVAADGSSRFDVREAAGSFRGHAERVEVARAARDGGASLVAESVGAAAGPARLDPDGVAHWDRREWRLSLDYFLASRRASFDDDGAGDSERATLARRLSSGAAGKTVEDDPHDCLRLPPGGPAPTLGKSLLARESTRNVRALPGRIGQVSTLLGWPLDQVRATRRVDPAAPLALFASFGVAFEFHLVAYDVKGIPSGLYEYGFDHHCLVAMRRGDLRGVMSEALIGQPAPRQGACTLCITADFRPWMLRYRHERALRNLYFDAGRIMQRLQLVAAGLGWRSCITPAVDDRRALEAIGLPAASHQVMYTITVG
ncbi:MAG TPA: SagB/ThcOx family dehydrogenase [Solirubrobacterales bacterium]